MKKKNMKIFNAGYQAGYYDGRDEAYIQSLNSLEEAFLEINTKWSKKAADYCAAELDILASLEEERKELEDK